MSRRFFILAAVSSFTCLTTPVRALEATQAQLYIVEGYSVVVDPDYQKYFDRLNYEVLIGKAITHCLDVVHRFPVDNGVEQRFFKHFDAYYNPASGQVENNAVYNGDQAPLFQFDKCMASRGFPLGSR